MSRVPEPFRLQIPDADIEDLRARISRTRFPDEPPLEPWSTGTSLHYLKDLLDYWREKFDWRIWEAKLNSFPQYGWPGSVLEFHKLIPLLTSIGLYGLRCAMP